MTPELLDKLLEYIDARIAEKSDYARDSSDGGLLESIRRRDIEQELRFIACGAYEKDRPKVTFVLPEAELLNESHAPSEKDLRTTRRASQR